MTRYYDGKKVLEISMIDENGIDFSADFFGNGNLPFDEEMSAYEVKDVEYLADYAEDYAVGLNPDFDNYGDDGDDTPVCAVITNIYECK